MHKIIKVSLVALAIATATTSVFAKEPAARLMSPDPWYQPIHLDDNSTAAEQYFSQMRTDGN
jgi:hypothetical protein